MNPLPLIILAFLIAFSAPAFAAMDPTDVSELNAVVEQQVTAVFSSGVNSAEITLMVPQEDAFQRVVSTEVSVPYQLTTDNYGNRMVKVTINNPSATEKFSVRSVVSISRKTDAALANIQAFGQPTELIQSDDSDIISLASSVTDGETGFGKTAAIAKWVNANIKYDLAYAGVNLSAKTTLQNRAGVCDEFSALTIAMLRSIGYKAAYIVGYSYGRGYTVADDFVAHGWVEACSESGCYQVDPTWGEAGWLDATHIKFATLPQSYYVEATAAANGRGQITVALENVKTKITITNFKESPLIASTVSALDGSVWKGYAVLNTGLSYQGCAMTKIRYGSCTQPDGSVFLLPETNESVAYFCGSKAVFTPFKIPETLQKNIVYTCDITSSPMGGEPKSATIKLDYNANNEEMPGLSVDKTSVMPDETVNAEATGSELFTDYGLYGRDSLSLFAPAKSFRLYAYRNGQLEHSDVTVLASIPLSITVNATKEPINSGDATDVDVRVGNIGDSEKAVTVRLGNQTRNARIAAGQTETFLFRLTTTDETKVAQAFVETEGFSTSASVPLNVIRAEKGLLDKILELLRLFIEGLFGG